MSKHRMFRPAPYLLAMFLLCVMPGHAQGEFVRLGDLPGGLFASVALAISADGTTVVGSAASTFGPVIDEAFRWTEATGMVPLGTLPGYSNSRAISVSADGAVVAGFSQTELVSGLLFEGFRWTQAAGLESLGSANTLAWGISGDGLVVVGEVLGGEAFRWTQATGFISIGPGIARGVSADGSVVVGGGTHGFRWTQETGQQPMGGVAWGVSADGSVVVGFSSGEAFRWTQATGLVGLGDLPGGEFYSSARVVSADGTVVVGVSAGALEHEAFLWDEVNGMRSLRDVLVAQGDNLTGWHHLTAQGVSADGQTIVGWGINPRGQTEGWLARLGRPSEVAEPSTVTLLGIGSLAMLLCSGVLGERRRSKHVIADSLKNIMGPSVQPSIWGARALPPVAGGTQRWLGATR